MGQGEGQVDRMMGFLASLPFFLICMREMEEAGDGRPEVRNTALGFIESGDQLVGSSSGHD